MFRNKTLLIGLMGLLLWLCVSSVSAQRGFNTFLRTFKTAVAKTDKTGVANLTVFPLIDEAENDEGPNPKYTRSKFLKKYSYFFDRGVSRCFQNPKLIFNDSEKKEVSISCNRGKKAGEFSYLFVKLNSGWKFGGFNTDLYFR